MLEVHPREDRLVGGVDRLCCVSVTPLAIYTGQWIGWIVRGLRKHLNSEH